MTKLYPEFYNDVFGPLMQHGSSSHMAAPCRIGCLCSSLLGEETAEILVEMDEQGSFSGTFGAMNEDLGMYNGAMGRAPDHPDFFGIKQELRDKGIPFRCVFCEMKESEHINSLKFTLTGKSGKKATLVANSTGGGMVETVWVNGFAFRGMGDTFVLCIFDRENALCGEALNKAVSAVQTVLEQGCGEGQTGGRMFWYKLDEAPSAALETALGDMEHAVMRPVLPVPTTARKQPQLFDTMTEWRRLAREQGKALSEVAIDYEMAASGWSREQVVDYMETVLYPAFYRRTHALYEEDVTPMSDPFSFPHHEHWAKAMPLLPVNMGVISKAIHYLMAANTPIPGVLNIPGPMGTGGGYLFSVLWAVKEDLDLPHEALIRGLFVSAGVGAICYTRTGPTGEVIGCTGECGVCTAMTAAGLTEMLGGTPEQVEAAASMALQASVGWPCDPIPGGKNMPCMSRVLFIAGMSIVYSQWAMAGMDPVLPFHEVVDVADKIGRDLPGELLCTARGGHCAAPTARALTCQFKEWHKKQ